ncbi:NfeD family protein [Blautia liquoris]|uniref:NfeD family protein n=1 Tax=Blautia liquoris TaxID=2779518 RepID=A0A7M2RIC8_9FIRM|nr:NfeD family protein [Blautia liquoris]QOV19297.1 NfeD family protein [Blautia liquoris]
MELLTNPMVWLIALIVFLAIEAMTLGLATIWFAGGALVAFIAALLGADLYIQIILFLAVSILLLVFTRPIAVRYLNTKKTPTNVDRLIGMQAIVTSKINNLKGKGEVEIGGNRWSARSETEDEIIDSGKTVEVVSIQGVKLIVRESEEERGD